MQMSSAPDLGNYLQEMLIKKGSYFLHHDGHAGDEVKRSEKECPLARCFQTAVGYGHSRSFKRWHLRFQALTKTWQLLRLSARMRSRTARSSQSSCARTQQLMHVQADRSSTSTSASALFPAAAPLPAFKRDAGGRCGTREAL